jgi:two-component system sensor histidine kinase ChiS
MLNKVALPYLLAASMLLATTLAVRADAGKASDVVYRVGSGTCLLKGPWERFEGLLPADELDGATSHAVYLPMRARTPNSSDSGPATYRTEIRIEGSNRKLAIYLPSFSGLIAAYADGRALYDKARDKASPHLLLFDASDGVVSLVLQIGSGEPGLEEASSFPSFVVFGDAESVYRSWISLGFMILCQDGFFVIAGLFGLILFFFWKKNRDFLAFSLFLLLVGLARGIEGSSLFLGLPYAMDKRGLDVAYFGTIALQCIALCFFLHTVYGNRIRKTIFLFLYAIFAVLAVAEVALPSLIGPISLAVEACCILFWLSAIANLSALAAKGAPRARWLALAFIVLPMAMAFRILGPESLWNAFLVEGAAIVAFAIVVLLILVKKVADSFESAESLSVYVDSFSRTVKNFIPTEFLDNLDKTNLVDLRLGDHAKKEMTIFFSDIRAFTELSEKLTVEENFAFINSYLSRVVPIIKDNGGFVDKYIGDAIMALFAGPSGADKAIRAAIAMQSKMVEYNGHRAKMGYRPISMGVGIHTGDLMLGVVGVSDRMENTVISDAVNLASRLQSITKAFNLGLAISEQSFKELEDPGSYKYRFIGKVKVKGKAAPVSVFEIFDGIAPDLFERKMKANMYFEQGMLSYYQKDFAGAMYYFKHTLEIIPEDGASGFYLDNCMDKASI